MIRGAMDWHGRDAHSEVLKHTAKEEQRRREAMESRETQRKSEE